MRRLTFLPIGTPTALSLMLSLACTMASTSPAYAQSAGDNAAAEALFDEGKRLVLAKVSA